MGGAALSTRFAGCSPIGATAILAGLAIAIGWCLSCCPLGIGAVGRPPDIEVELADARLYKAVTQHVRNGKSYYDAADRELVSRGYPVGSVFQWRLPTYAWMLGSKGGEWGGRAVLGFLVLASGIQMCGSFTGNGSRVARPVVAAAHAGSYGWILHPYPVYFMELWSGLLIAISLMFLSKGRWLSGLVAGVAAMSIRELTIPYMVILAVYFLFKRRTSAYMLTVLSLVVFLALFAEHADRVDAKVPETLSTNYSSWVDFGGTPFLIRTCRMNFLLACLPPWLAAFYLPLAMVGLAGWRSPQAAPFQATAFIYALLFYVFGKSVNNYWGWMTVPILGLGFFRAPSAVIDLISAARRPRGDTTSMAHLPGARQPEAGRPDLRSSASRPGRWIASRERLSYPIPQPPSR